MSKVVKTSEYERRQRKKFFQDLVWPNARYIKVIFDLEEINRILEYMYSCTNVIIGPRPRRGASLSTKSYIYLDKDKVILTVMGYDGCFRMREYGFWLDDRTESMIGGYDVWQDLESVYRVKSIKRIAKTDEEKEIIDKFTVSREVMNNKRKQKKHNLSAAELRYSESKEKRKEDNIYCYDLNSAYGAIARDKMPDFNHPTFDTVVGKNEVGFNPEKGLLLAHEGEYAIVAFPLIDSPFREWIDKRFKEKQTAKKGSIEKEDAKAKLVKGWGYYENINLLYRAYIVNTLREYMMSIKDKNTIYINTDCIHSRVPRPDLELGEGIGQWKLEHVGKVSYPDAKYIDEKGRIKNPTQTKKKLYEFNYIKRRIEKCTTLEKTRKQEKQSFGKILSLSEVISKLSTKYTMQ